MIIAILQSVLTRYLLAFPAYYQDTIRSSTLEFVHRARFLTKSSALHLLVIFFIVMGFALSQQRPSPVARYIDEFSLESEVEVSNHTILLTNVRDWQYQGREIIEKRWVDREISLNSLERVWFVVESFGKWDGIAHTFFIFDFADQEPLSFSIEAKREPNESFSPIKGIFNQYELGYFWGNETDFLIRRVEYLGHKVYMYPLLISSDAGKTLLRALAAETRDLTQTPRYYNTLTSNCTNSLANIVNQVEPGLIPWHPARLFTGYADNYLHQLGLIDNSQAFESIEQKHYVSDLVTQYADSDTFSEDLRSAIHKRIND